MAASDVRRAALVDGIVQGVLFGLAMGLLSKLDDHTSWSRAAVSFAVTGTLFGGFVSFCNRKSRRRQLSFLADLDPAQQRDVRRAVRGGPVPQDARVRGRAAELAMWSQHEWRRSRTLNTVVLVVVLLGNIALALTDSPWWWLTAPGIAAGLVQVRLWPERLERRVHRLQVG